MTSGSGTMEHTPPTWGYGCRPTAWRSFSPEPRHPWPSLWSMDPATAKLAWLPVSFQGVDHAELLVQLLSEVVYLWDAEGLLTVAA